VQRREILKPSEQDDRTWWVIYWDTKMN
jgi:hypothetical protein